VAFLTSNYSFTNLNESRFVNNGLHHLRYIRRHRPRARFEAFTQYQFNEFIRLDERIVAGVGGRFVLRRSRDSSSEAGADRRTEVFLGVGYQLEREVLDLPAGPARSEHHRSTNYLTVRFNSRDERLRLVQTTYLQPRLDAPEDFRIRSETSFEIQLLRQLSLAINLNVTHDSDPPTSVEATDVVLSNSLRYSF